MNIMEISSKMLGKGSFVVVMEVGAVGKRERSKRRKTK